MTIPQITLAGAAFGLVLGLIISRGTGILLLIVLSALLAYLLGRILNEA